jgi:glycosyltransferase involved in cell wall biosynthesis
MDLVAEMFLRERRAHAAAGVRAERVCPTFRRRARRLPWLGRRPTAVNVDRLLNRFWDYPRHLRRARTAFDLFHVCDHSYAHLIHALPAGGTGVFCHDLDAFRCLLEPGREPRPRWFKALARHVLRGLQRAALVFYATGAVHRQLVAHGLVDPARMVQVPYGVAPEYALSPAQSNAGPPARADEAPFLLHVGSCIPRKRVDVLLDVFAAVRARHPGIRLVQVGGQFTAGQREQIEQLGVGPKVTQIRGLERRTLALLYRQAAVVLQPSEAEGFGLPVIEALACGAAVVASDLPALREAGGAAVLYRPVADVAGWAETVCRLLDNPAAAPERTVRLAQAGCFSWAAHARTIVAAYRRLYGAGQEARHGTG